MAFCQYSLAFSVFENDSTVIWTCRFASGIDINGLSNPFPNALDLLNPDSISRFEAYLAAALDASGYQGEVLLTSFPFSGGYTFHIVITSSDAPDIALNFQFCGLQYDFVQEDCCEKNAPPPPAGAAANLLPHNDDLFYEEITYNGLDISRIEIGSDCSLGYMRNDFSYDENHRVIKMLNTFFNPGPIAGRYNTSYAYDAAGNITRLNRYGLIDATAGQYTYGLIDNAFVKSWFQSLLRGILFPSKALTLCNNPVNSCL